MNYYESKCDGIAHVIRKGDTLYRLGRMYGVSVESIMEANPGARVYHLVPEKLYVSHGYGKNAGDARVGTYEFAGKYARAGKRPAWLGCDHPYTVREGESLNSLLETFHMDFSDFEKLNPELMPILLTPGEKVYVKKEQNRSHGGTINLRKFNFLRLPKGLTRFRGSSIIRIIYVWQQSGHKGFVWTA